MRNRGSETWPAKYPAIAFNGIAANITAKRMTAPATSIAASDLNRFRDCSASV